MPRRAEPSPPAAGVRVSQHALRSPRGGGRSPRAVNTAEHQARLAARLTGRDRWLIRMLFEHRVFTTSQIQAMAFPSARAANTRLLELYRWRVLGRFQPFRPVGSAPMHYVLDIAGAAVLAAETGTDPKRLGYRHERAVAIAHSLQLAHTVGRNQVLVDLLAAATAHPAAARGGALEAWWGETRCARVFGDLVRPDGYAHWRESHAHLAFFLEYDTGTENLTQLAAKLTGYHALAAATEISTPVLFWLPSLRREASARRALAAAMSQLDRPRLVPVATTAADPSVAGDGLADVAGVRWLPLDPTTSRAAAGRLPLAALGDRWPATAAHGTNTPGWDAGSDAHDLPAPSPTPPPGISPATNGATA
jgi:hypothetical protein